MRLPLPALAERPPAEELAAATHPAKPMVARHRLDKEDPRAMVPHRLVARLEVEVEAARRLRHRRRQHPKTRTTTAWTLCTWAAVPGTFSIISDGKAMSLQT